MVKAFVDDSGSGGDSPWYVLAGYYGTVCDWVGFEADWRTVLDSSPAIAYFKASEAESLKEQFLGFTREQSNTKIDALISVIGQHAQCAIHVRMRQNLYDEILKPNIPEMWDDPYFFLFPAFISAVLSAEKYFGKGEPAEFVFDSSQRVDQRAQELYSQLLGLPQYAGRMVDVILRSEKDFLPLQAADLLAWQVRRAFCVSTEPRRPHYDAAQKCPKREAFPVILDKHDLLKGLGAMQDNARKFAANLGIPIEVFNKHVLKRKKRKKQPKR